MTFYVTDFNFCYNNNYSSIFSNSDDPIIFLFLYNYVKPGEESRTRKNNSLVSIQCAIVTDIKKIKV